MSQHLAEERHFEVEQVLGDGLLRRHVRDARERQHPMRAPGLEQRPRERERMREDHVVVGQAMHDEQRSFELRRQPNDLAAFVRAGIGRRVAEESFGVVRVVEAPVGHRRARDRSVEHVGATQHRERREIPAEGPTAHADLRQVEVVMQLRPTRPRHRPDRRSPGRRDRCGSRVPTKANVRACPDHRRSRRRNLDRRTTAT